MNLSFSPQRELYYGMSIGPAHGGATGDAVEMGPFAGPASFLVVAGKNLATSRTVTFEATGEDPSNAGSPDAGGWTAINTGGFCDEAAALSVVVDPASADFVADAQLIIRADIQCRFPFVRAKLNTADDNVAVLVLGKAKRVVEA